MNKAITINSIDNLAVALRTLKKGEVISVKDLNILLLENIQVKHKFAIHDLAAGDEMYMYGLVVGTARKAIRSGEAITLSNTEHKASKYDPTKISEFRWTAPNVERFKERNFLGYHREDGQVGTANNWLVFPLVFCENRNVLTLKKAFEKLMATKKTNPYENLVQDMVAASQSGASFDKLSLKKAKKLDQKQFFDQINIKFITHEGGCGGTREDSDSLCRLLAGYLKNPNVAGATILSLGCQNAQVNILQKAIKNLDTNLNKPLLIFDQQKIGNESLMLEQAIKETFKALIEANKIERKPAPLSKLTLGLECGGSDGFSGISANPALGRVADLITALGGKAILSEFPELCGVEQELMNRTSNPTHAEKFLKLMRSYSELAVRAGSGFDMNPSPGNIKDGLITDAMKSAGAAKKGGSSPINDVLDYTEYVKQDGLSLLCTPGNDVESTTGLVGSGANIVLFSTGLGTPTGNPIAPVLKVSSNTDLTKKMTNIIDINAGLVIDGNQSLDELSESILEHIIKVASGEIECKADQLNQEDFIFWKRGVSL